MNHNFLITSSLFLSQFYILPSGLPQPGHLLILIAIAFFLIKNKSINNKKIVSILSIFIFYISLINLTWSIINSSTTYIISTIYWFFNFFLFLYLTNQKEIDFEKIQKIIFFSFLFMIAIWFLDLGNYKFYPRYNGFFNDPNQMAFWILCSMSIYLLKPNKNQIPILALGLFLIILTSSRSALLGVIFIFLGHLIKNQLSIKSLLIKIISLITLGIFLFYIITYNTAEINFITDRLLETKLDQQADIRGYTALLENPEYLFFGTGQGDYFRFIATKDEIHSTWAGILFYYGAIGIFLFFYFLNLIFSKLSLHEKMMFLGPIVYSFSTYGARTIIFWFFLSFYYLYGKSK